MLPHQGKLSQEITLRLLFQAISAEMALVAQALASVWTFLTT